MQEYVKLSKELEYDDYNFLQALEKSQPGPEPAFLGKIENFWIDLDRFRSEQIDLDQLRLVQIDLDRFQRSTVPPPKKS